jgi:hypothetical protein
MSNQKTKQEKNQNHKAINHSEGMFEALLKTDNATAIVLEVSYL